MRAFTALFAAFALFTSVPAQAVPHYKIKIVNIYPHDPRAFTEGLFYSKGFLYESTGMNGRSFIRKEDLYSGMVLKQANVDSQYFGEGIAPWAGKIISLTWQTGVGFVWSGASFHLAKSFTYAGEGWGMTQNGENLIMSDGTPTIKFLDPKTFGVVRTIQVTLDGRPIDQINELEWVKGELLANVWRTDEILRIDPKSGNVTGVVDISSLPETQIPNADPDAVANGIAYDPAKDRLFFTGKMWPHLYEVKLVPQN